MFNNLRGFNYKASWGHSGAGQWEVESRRDTGHPLQNRHNSGEEGVLQLTPPGGLGIAGEARQENCMIAAVHIAADQEGGEGEVGTRVPHVIFRGQGITIILWKPATPAEVRV